MTIQMFYYFSAHSWLRHAPNVSDYRDRFCTTTTYVGCCIWKCQQAVGIAPKKHILVCTKQTVLFRYFQLDYVVFHSKIASIDEKVGTE